MFAELHLHPRPKVGGTEVEIDHAVCFNCGLPQESTYGGNIIVALTLILQTQGPKHWKFAVRAGAIAGQVVEDHGPYLFDENGWNGRHKRIARIIDRNLTMKLSLEPGPGKVRFGRVQHDWDYLRPEEAA